ncbi:MAG: glycosyltransferase family 2 protein [Candidatus Eremiobacteraeota bacterium]|nr:glycosyltransferase family 2 protein [Candidatus Eremiobacteraeota bacterium]
MNEAANLPRLLTSLPAGIRALVVDANSGDRTVAIAREYGAEIAIREWEGFVATRRWAQARVTTPWTLMLDADERLDDEARRAIVAVDPETSDDGFVLRRTTWFCGRPIRGMGWGDERLLRLFRTDRARLVASPVSGGGGQVHERWELVPGALPARTLRGVLEHDSYPTLKSYARKFGRYTSLEARGLPPSLRRLIGVTPRSVFRAGWLLFARGGWRDGWRGAFVAVASAVYPVVVAWKALRT